jgi:hypothetical protein
VNLEVLEDNEEKKGEEVKMDIDSHDLSERVGRVSHKSFTSTHNNVISSTYQERDSLGDFSSNMAYSHAIV